jgi:hypothetical protein
MMFENLVYENLVIVIYLLMGACFGLASFPYRHLFSEGPEKVNDSEQTSLLRGRLFWVLVCTWLWPIMVLTGINTARIISKRKRKPQNNSLHM